MAISPVTYQYNRKSGFDTHPEYVGVIAQELKKVTPYMTGTFEHDGQEYLDVNNSAMTYLLINSVKEQQQQLSEKDKRIHALERAMLEKNRQFEMLMQRISKLEVCTDCPRSVGSRSMPVNTDVADPSSPVLRPSPAPFFSGSLSQNIPNPFSNTSIIRYELPETSSGEIEIMDIIGKVWKSIKLNHAKGQVVVEASEFPTGTYFFSLKVNGKTVATRKMVCVE